MHKYFLWFNGLLLTCLFASVATATPTPSSESETKNTTTENQIPHKNEVELHQHSAKLLLKQPNSSVNIAQTPNTPDTEIETEIAKPADIDLDVIGTPINTIEKRQSSPTGVIIYDQKEIKRYGHRTIGEVLRRLPGVVIGGPPGEDKDVQLLGLPKEYTQILIDGHRFPDGGENREFKVDRIPVELVDRIEIISNPTATQDSQGIGGTVNIVLKSAPDKRISEISLYGAKLSNGVPFGGVNVIYGDRVGDFGYIINAGIQTRESPKDKIKEARNAQNVLTQTERENEDKSQLDISFAPRFTWQVSPKDTINFNPLFLQTTEDKDKEKKVLNSRFFSTGRIQETRQQQVQEEETKTMTGWRLSGDWKRQLSPDADMTLGLLYQRSDEIKDKTAIENTTTTTFLNQDGSPPDPRRPMKTDITSKREDERKNDQEFKGNVAFNWQVSPAHRLSLGLEGSLRDREKNKRTFERKSPTDPEVEKSNPKDIYSIEENQFNAYLQDEIRLGDKHTLVAGLRMESVNNTATARDRSVVGQSGTILNPSLHYKFDITPNTVFRLSTARTIRRPKFDDLIPYVETKNGSLLQPDKVGNPNLQPETSTGLEMGIEQSWDNGNSIIGLNGFYRWIDNKIETQVQLNPNNNRYEEIPINVGDGKVYGVRLDGQTSASFIGLRNLTLLANVSLLGSEVTDKKTGNTRRFNDQPKYVANLGFDYAVPDWGMNFGLNYNIMPSSGKEELKDGVYKVETTETDPRLDAYVAFKVSDNVKLRFFGNNLLRSSKSKSVTESNTAGVLQNSRIESEKIEQIWGVNLSWQF